MDHFQRKEFIKLSALGFASVALQLQTLSAFAQQANGHFGKWDAATPLNWDAFLERLTRLASTQHDLPWNQQRYTRQVKRLLLQCDFPQFENIKQELEAYENKTPNWFEAASLHYEVDFQVSLFQFEPGEYIPHHDHPNMTGVINVVSGSMLAKNYSVEHQLPSTTKQRPNEAPEIIKKCVLREVAHETVSAGQVSMLNAHKGNIHSVMPTAFTQLVDVFTPAYHQDTNASWYVVNEAECYEGRKGLHEAEYSATRPG
ncbi:MAG: hypothetical protein AAGB22_01610 [Bacteroidota bacterium]